MQKLQHSLLKKLNKLQIFLQNMKSHRLKSSTETTNRNLLCDMCTMSSTVFCIVKIRGRKSTQMLNILFIGVISIVNVWLLTASLCGMCFQVRGSCSRGILVYFCL